MDRRGWPVEAINFGGGAIRLNIIILMLNLNKSGPLTQGREGPHNLVQIHARLGLIRQNARVH
jgi:hypothetical protein